MIQFISKKLNKLITNNREQIPKKLKEIVFIKKDNVVIYDFFDMDKVSISNEMIEIPFDETNLYEYLTNKINLLISTNDLVENTEYIFNVGWKYRNVANYLDRTKFIDARHKAKLNINDLANRIGISRESIYLIESNEVKNVRSDMLIKYSLFFRKPISYFLKDEFKNKLVNIDTQSIVDSGVISEEQKDKILSHLLV